jgi:hypothetical protein
LVVSIQSQSGIERQEQTGIEGQLQRAREEEARQQIIQAQQSQEQALQQQQQEYEGQLKSKTQETLSQVENRLREIERDLTTLRGSGGSIGRSDTRGQALINEREQLGVIRGQIESALSEGKYIDIEYEGISQQAKQYAKDLAQRTNAIASQVRQKELNLQIENINAKLLRSQPLTQQELNLSRSLGYDLTQRQVGMPSLPRARTESMGELYAQGLVKELKKQPTQQQIRQPVSVVRAVEPYKQSFIERVSDFEFFPQIKQYKKGLAENIEYYGKETKKGLAEKDYLKTAESGLVTFGAGIYSGVAGVVTKPQNVPVSFFELATKPVQTIKGVGSAFQVNPIGTTGEFIGQGLVLGGLGRGVSKSVTKALETPKVSVSKGVGVSELSGTKIIGEKARYGISTPEFQLVTEKPIIKPLKTLTFERAKVGGVAEVKYKLKKPELVYIKGDLDTLGLTSKKSISQLGFITKNIKNEVTSAGTSRILSKKGKQGLTGSITGTEQQVGGKLIKTKTIGISKRYARIPVSEGMQTYDILGGQVQIPTRAGTIERQVGLGISKIGKSKKLIPEAEAFSYIRPKYETSTFDINLGKQVLKRKHKTPLLPSLIQVYKEIAVTSAQTKPVSIPKSVNIFFEDIAPIVSIPKRVQETKQIKENVLFKTPEPKKTQGQYFVSPEQLTKARQQTELIGLKKERGKVTSLDLLGLARKQKVSEVLLSGVLGLSKTGTKEKQASLLRIKQLELSRQAEKTLSLERLAERQALKERLLQKQLLKQTLLQGSRLINVRVPKITGFGFGATPSKKQLLINKIKFLQGFQTQIKRRGKFFTIGEILPLGLAKQLGERATTTSLARTFRLIPKGTTIKKDILSKVNQNIFRNYIIRKGQRILTPLQYTERRGKTLKNIFETGEIQRAKKRKRRATIW